ncbi:MAG: NACHT domain-containing protein, partial [Gammaproteobacteria bacterium]
MWSTFTNKLSIHTQEQAKFLQRPIAGENWQIDNSFINLALLLQKKQIVKLKENQQNEKDQSKINDTISWHDLHVNQVEKVYESKQALRYEDLLEPIVEDEQKKLRSKIWLVGAAGSGKTTLSQHIAYDWSTSQQRQFNNTSFLPAGIATTATSSSNNHSAPTVEIPTQEKSSARLTFLNHAVRPIKLVLWIKLRELAADIKQHAEIDKDHPDIKSLATRDILPDKHFCLSLLRLLQKQEFDIDSLGLSVPQLNQLIKDHTENILYLLDGYDEIASYPKEHAVHTIFQH